MIEGNYDPLLLYFISNKIAAYSHFWRSNVSPLANRYFTDSVIKMRPPPDPDYEKAVQVYLKNTKLIRAVSREFNIRPLFVLQPMIFTKNNLTPFEAEVLKEVVNINKPHADYMRAFYRTVKTRMAQRADFVDLTAILDDRREIDCIDHGHTGPATGIVIGKAMYDALAVKHRDLFPL